MKRTNLLFVSFIIIVALFLPGISGAVTYDLKTDWNDTNPNTNPNAIWTFWKGNTQLPLQTVYASAYPEYGSGYAQAPFPDSGHVPAWLQVDSANSLYFNFLAGDIIFHPTSTYPSSLNPIDLSYVLWTSPVNGTITISGDVWYGGLFFGNQNRGVNTHLYVNGSLISAADRVVSEYSYNTRADRATFSGGGTFNVHKGDTVKLVGDYSGFDYPWFVGVNLTIDATETTIPSTPEPGTMLLLGLGLMGLAGVKRRMSK